MESWHREPLCPQYHSRCVAVLFCCVCWCVCMGGGQGGGPGRLSQGSGMNSSAVVDVVTNNMQRPFQGLGVARGHSMPRHHHMSAYTHCALHAHSMLHQASKLGCPCTAYLPNVPVSLPLNPLTRPTRLSLYTSTPLPAQHACLFTPQPPYLPNVPVSLPLNPLTGPTCLSLYPSTPCRCHRPSSPTLCVWRAPSRKATAAAAWPVCVEAAWQCLMQVRGALGRCAWSVLTCETQAANAHCT
jgi:hypothetical protein